jgi:hypothetical protein
MIKAECHSDDRNVEVSFDATPWFKQASDKDILDLANCGWGGDYPADEVAEWMAGDKGRRGVKRIAEMFKYLEIIHGDPSKKNAQGFECHVDEEDARKCLAENRPKLVLPTAAYE